MIYLLGHKIAAVGFAEALNLVNSSKMGEKLTVCCLGLQLLSPPIYSSLCFFFRILSNFHCRRFRFRFFYFIYFFFKKNKKPGLHVYIDRDA